MKIFSTFIFPCILLTVICCASRGPARLPDGEEKELKNGISLIINDLIRLVNTTEGVKDHYPAEVIDTTLKRINTGKLRLVIDLKIDNNIYGGMGFAHTGKMEYLDPGIHISPSMIRLYKTRPSIVLSAFVHESMHANSFFMDTKHFVANSNNILENYFYQLDAYNCEARFIRDYLKNNPKFKLTKFEQVLEKSFTEDNLDNFSFGLLGFDMRLSFYLNKIHKMDTPYDKQIQLVDKLIVDYINKGFIDKKDEFDNYTQLVPIYTILQYTPQSIVYIDYKAGKKTTSQQYSFKTQHPELYEKLLRLEKVFGDNAAYYFTYNSKIKDLFKKVD